MSLMYGFTEMDIYQLMCTNIVAQIKSKQKPHIMYMQDDARAVEQHPLVYQLT